MLTFLESCELVGIQYHLVIGTKFSIQSGLVRLIRHETHAKESKFFESYLTRIKACMLFSSLPQFSLLASFGKKSHNFILQSYLVLNYHCDISILYSLKKDLLSPDNGQQKYNTGEKKCKPKISGRENGLSDANSTIRITKQFFNNCRICNQV